MYLMLLQTCLWSRVTSKAFHLQNKKPEGFYLEAASEKMDRNLSPSHMWNMLIYELHPSVKIMAYCHSGLGV